jgi:manganese/iron transport system permease protein
MIVLIVVVALYKELLFYTFYPLRAQAAGLPVNRLNFGLILLITLTILASIKAVGVILVLSLLITPGATAYLLLKRLHEVMIPGAVIGVISSITGMYLSYFYNLPSGPVIVLVVSSLFILPLLFTPRNRIFTSHQMKSAENVRG